jgi:hypothetical protein
MREGFNDPSQATWVNSVNGPESCGRKAESDSSRKEKREERDKTQTKLVQSDWNKTVRRNAVAINATGT